MKTIKGLIYAAAAGVAIALFFQGIWSIEASHPTMWRICIIILGAAAITFVASIDRQPKRKGRAHGRR